MKKFIAGLLYLFGRKKPNPSPTPQSSVVPHVTPSSTPVPVPSPSPMLENCNFSVTIEVQNI